MPHHNIVTYVLLLSILVQISAALMALRLIRITERRVAWSCIATALILMAVRRIIPLYRLISGDMSIQPDPVNEFIGLVLSTVMAIGIARIVPLFIERKRMEESLRVSEARLADAQRIAKIGNWEWDVSDNRLWWSKEAFRLFDMQPEEFGATFESFINAVHPDDRERVQGSIRKALQVNSGGWQIDYRISHADGTTHFIHEDAETVFDQDGRPLKRVGTVQDVTERTRAEEEIRTLNRELEQRVRDRTIQLEEANRELEAFAYTVSHDLRAPLRHIDGFIELLQERTAGSLDDKSRHYIATSSDAAKRLGVLIDDFLTFSRIGRQEMYLRQVDLKTLVQEVIQEFEPEIQGRSVRWNIADLPTLTCDRAMLRIVIVNLISNALKFTRPCGQAEIEIVCRSEGAETIVFVRDNGVGFDIEYADKLFGVFQRLHRTEEFEGTGIGLAHVRRIISRHGGRTWAEGRVDQGAVFYFSLPSSMDKKEI